MNRARLERKGLKNNQDLRHILLSIDTFSSKIHDIREWWMVCFNRLTSCTWGALPG